MTPSAERRAARASLHRAVARLSGTQNRAKTGWRIVLPACISLLLAGLPALAACPDDARRLAVGSDLHAASEAAPEGAVFCLARGTHRMQSIEPKRGQRFHGERGAVLNGSQLLTRFSREGRLWFADDQTQRGPRLQTQECLPDRPRCSYPEAVFVDDRPLVAVESKAKVDVGSFFFDYGARRIYIAVDPRGRTIEASVAPQAFLGGARNVTIEGLRIEKYSTPIQAAAVGGSVASPGWVVTGNTVRLNHSVGITVGTGSRVEGNLIADNGEMGIGCVGDDILIVGNEIARNGFFAGLDPAWEGGGGKCALTRRLTVRGNYTHHNNSYGFWTDIDNIDSLYEDNRVESNTYGGISHEISYRAVIRNNRFRGNGRAFDVWLWGGAIQIQNSRDVEVYGNTVEVSEGGNGITLIQQRRGSGRYGPYVTTGNEVRNNRIIMRTPGVGASGAVADYDEAGLQAGGNRFHGNAYRVARAGDDQWAWLDFYPWDSYRRVSGQDADSRLVVGR